MTKQGCRQVAETDIQVSAPRERSGEPHHGPQSLTPDQFDDVAKAVMKIRAAVE